MNDIPSPKVYYRKKPITQVRTEVTQKLETAVEPTPVIADLPDIPKKRGPEKHIVQNWDQGETKGKIKKYIKQGLSPKEAGIMAGLAPEKMDDLMERSDSFRRFVQVALIEFKQSHLEVISSKRDTRMSQWLLEKSFPEEFNKKPPKEGGHGDGSSTTVIQAIVKTVQATPDEAVPVEYKDVTKDRKEKSNDGTPQNHKGLEPSLDGGGANII